MFDLTIQLPCRTHTAEAVEAFDVHIDANVGKDVGRNAVGGDSKDLAGGGELYFKIVVFPVVRFRDREKLSVKCLFGPVEAGRDFKDRVD